MKFYRLRGCWNSSSSLQYSTNLKLEIWLLILIDGWNMNTFSTCVLINFFIFLQSIFWILVKDMSNFIKMRGFFLFVLLLINCTVSKGQIYKYIGLEDGLNNQKIYHIQKDRRGYMWFLTQEGIDRYDGKHIKHYNFFRR